MRRLLTVFSLSLFMTFAVFADVIIDSNTPINADILNPIVVDPVTGDMSITSDENHVITVSVETVGSNVLINSFAITSPVLINENTTLTWVVNNATACAGSNNFGLASFNGSVNAASGNIPFNVGPSAGTFTFTLSCNDGGPAVESNVILTVNSAPAVAINSFNVTPSTIEAGENVSISWDTSFADSCSASGAPQWSGAVAASGTNVQVTIASAGNYTLTLTCSNSTSPSVQQARNVTVTNPSNNCTAPTLDGTIRDWTTEFSGNVWPNPSFGQQLFGVVPRRGYTALEFNTGTVVANGGMVTAAVTANSGTRLGSISPCPGDFASVPSNCLKDWGPGSSLKWSTRANPASNECALAPNTTYYFNLTFTDGSDRNTETCEIFGFGSTCFTTLRVFFE